MDSGSKAWALVVLSDTVSEEDVARKENWPEDWIVLTKYVSEFS